jgi:hypothetical protein
MLRPGPELLTFDRDVGGLARMGQPLLPGLMLRGSPHGAAASVPLFVFWLGLMASVWSFLLGFVRVFGGTFTVVEILLSIVIGGASVLGLVAAMRLPTTGGRSLRFATAVCFSLLQYASFWLSLQPFVASR